MDIAPPLLVKKSLPILSGNPLVNLKLNQKLDVQVVKNNLNTKNLTFKITPSNISIQVESNIAFNTKQGQNFQLLVSKLHPLAEFKILVSDTQLKYSNINQGQPAKNSLNLKDIVLKQLISNISETTEALSLSRKPTVFTAKIITILEDRIQLKLDKPEKLGTQQLFRLTNLKIIDNNSIITLKKEDILPSQKGINPQTLTSFNFKLGQKLQLSDLSKEYETNPKFKIINITPEKLKKGQIITATILDTKHNKIQLLLHTNNSSHNIDSTTITLNKNQLTSQILDNKNIPLGINNLKKGELITFQVVKPGNQAEFKLVDQNPLFITKLKIQDTVKQALPAQIPPSELVTQLVKNLSTINNNDSIPDNLKRLAKQILDSIPHIKSNKFESKNLKQSVLNSGLFLEAKLIQSIEKNDLNLQTDLKNQLVKLHHTVKQELESQQKTTSTNIELLQEIQKKTEGSLAKIILNQLASLPKEDGVKQAWILDIPFINKEFSESAKIEIERGQYKEGENNLENWTVTITITPPNLGTIHCKVTCIDKTINTRFWSETEHVVSKITHNLDYLKTQFEKVGIETGHMFAHTGADNNDAIHNPDNQNIFDQKA